MLTKRWSEIRIWEPKLWYHRLMRKSPRPMIVDDDVIRVPVYTKGKIIYGLVDKLDLDKVTGYLWSMTTNGYVTCSSKKHSSRYLHRIIANAGPYDHTDHINGDKLDNRRSNLRLVTAQQNQMARHVVVGKSGYKGVHKRGEVYRAHIKFNQKIIHLGSYPTAWRAAKAYNQAAKALFGEYAVINEVTYEDNK